MSHSDGSENVNRSLNDIQWMAGPLDEDLQTQLDRFFQSTQALRTVICRIRYKLHFAGFNSEFDIVFENLSLETALAILRFAEKRFLTNTSEINLCYSQVQYILSRSSEALRLAGDTKADMDNLRAQL